MRRSERLVVLTKLLMEQPRTLFSLNYFSELMAVAKSTISEDISIIKETFQSMNLGILETVAGAAGGIRYIPHLNKEEIRRLLLELADKLSNADRIIPGGFLYMTDLIFEPRTAARIGEAFATYFGHLQPDYIITVETKGIPLALMTARAFNIPLVIIRADSKVTEGSSVSINYVSGSSRKIRTMSLSRRAIPSGAKVLIIDDFMKAGGTAKGMTELMEEFNADVVGIGVLVGTVEPYRKLVQNYLALLELEKVDEEIRQVIVKPGRVI